jgi:hypothetical protein
MSDEEQVGDALLTSYSHSLSKLCPKHVTCLDGSSDKIQTFLDVQNRWTKLLISAQSEDLFSLLEAVRKGQRSHSTLLSFC